MASRTDQGDPRATTRADAAALVASLEQTSPGFADRVRAALERAEASLEAPLAGAFVETLALSVRLEGPGREASDALLALDAAAAHALGTDGLRAWGRAFALLAPIASRAASTFAAASLGPLQDLPAARLGELEGAARAVADLATRHGGDATVQSFA